MKFRGSFIKLGKDERIPVPLQKLAETWKQNHPGWEYRLWTDKENRDFLNTFYPAFLARYDFASVQPCSSGARVALTKSWRRSRDCAFGGSLASRLLLCWWWSCWPFFLDCVL